MSKRGSRYTKNGGDRGGEGLTLENISKIHEILSALPLSLHPFAGPFN